MPTFHAVIARYEEDVNWARRLPMPATIYNKGKTPTGLESELPVVARPNVGREAETYLHHIVENYNALPDYTLFLQGNPFDHCHNLLAILADRTDAKKFVPLSMNMKREPLAGEYNWQGFRERLHELVAMVGLSPSQTVIYASGAQCIVPREAMLARPKELYKTLLARTNYEAQPLEAWGMERLWSYLFGVKNKANAFCFDIFAARRTEPLAEAVAAAKAARPDIAFEIHEVAQESAMLDSALRNGQDLVCFFDSDQSLDSSTFFKLLDLYYETKIKLRGEADLVLGFGKNPRQSFLTHHGLLLQHGARLFDRERDVPFLAV